jgi:sodium transport system permease protein
MSIIWTVWRKELSEYLRDRRRLIWNLVTAFVLMPLLFVAPTAYLMLRTSQQMSNTITIPVQGMGYAPELMNYLKSQADIDVVEAQDVESLVRGKQYSGGLIVPPGFEEKIKRGEPVTLQLVTDQSKSVNVIGTRLLDALEAYRNELLMQRLQARNLPQDFLQPFKVEQRNAATATETTGSFLSLFLPGIVLAFGLSAGMQMAVSTSAGEKERLTLEPVLFTPVSRTQLVLGKLLAVVTSVIAFFVSMGLSIGLSAIGFVVVLAARGGLNGTSGTGLPSPDAFASMAPQVGTYSISPLAVVLLLFSVLPVITLGASIQVALATWARNSDEAYGYLNPINFVSTLLVFALILMEDFVPKLWQYGIPIFGTILSMRDLLTGKWQPAALTVMLVTSLVYALLAVGLAAWMYRREEVLFRS